MAYLHPGVYVEEIPSGSKPIEGVATSVTAFVGPVRRGPVDRTVPIGSWDDYVKEFGGITDPKGGDHMGLAVYAFYQNGGKLAYVARVSADTPVSRASLAVRGQGTGNADVLRVSASSPGEWGREVAIRISKAAVDSLTFDLEVGTIADQKLKVEERFRGLSMNALSDDFVLKRINGASLQIAVTLEPAADPDNSANQYQAGSLTGAELGSGSNVFANVQDGMKLTLNVDGRGAKQIDLGNKADLSLAGQDNKADGDKVAAKIQGLVRNLGAQDCYRNFTCTYSANRKFLLASGKASSSSSVSVYDGDGSPADLAKFLKLDSAAKPVAVHGSAKVVPQTVGSDPVNPNLPANQGVRLDGGLDGPPLATDYKACFGRLAKVRDVSVVVLPGKSLPADRAFVDEAVAHCEATRSRMVIIDPGRDLVLKTEDDVGALGLPTTTYGVVYYPWVTAPNPLYNPDSVEAVTTPQTVALPPSAFAAGLWSKIDGRRGVWKAPAGVESGLLGATGLRQDAGDDEQGKLNPLGVNCLRRLPGFGAPVIWGTRTLSTKTSPEWRYVPVRRTAIMIEQSIFNGIQWAVFEPNDHRLWSALRLNIESFMNGLFRAGAFQGEKVSDAYFVRCGLGDTMSQGDIDAGQVIVVVGFAPVKPAEFVIVRIQQKVGQQ
jgi:phage tail sheath protein FI